MVTVETTQTNEMKLIYTKILLNNNKDTTQFATQKPNRRFKGKYKTT